MNMSIAKKFEQEILGQVRAPMLMRQAFRK